MSSGSRAVGGLVAAAVLVVGVAGCASATNAKPETKTFAFTGRTLDVHAHDIPTDLVPTDRHDIRVTRWFDAKSFAVTKTWTLSGDDLNLRAECRWIANCDARFRVEVPRGVAVTRDGRKTNLRGKA